MDCRYDTKIESEFIRGQLLQKQDRGVIQRLHRLVYSNQFIASEINFTPSRVGNELIEAHHHNGATKAAPSYSAK